MSHTKLLCLAAAVALLSALPCVALWGEAGAYAQVKVPVNPNEPITMTKGMYADLLCVAAYQFDCYWGGFQFTYEPASDTIRAEYLPPTRHDPVTNAAQAEANRRSQAKERAERKAQVLVAALRRHVSPAAACAPVNF
jgi:hypothetical protein